MNKNDYILISNLSNTLAKNNYYITYAKSLLGTNSIDTSSLDNNKLITEMFKFFVQSKELRIYFQNSQTDLEELYIEANSRLASFSISEKHSNQDKESTFIDIWDNEVYVNIQDLKKLYANKCIVFPNSLLKKLQNE